MKKNHKRTSPLNESCAQQTHSVDELTLWRHKIRGTKSAVLPNYTARPNPLVVGDVVVASIFSPGIVYAVDRKTGRQRWRLRMDGLAGSNVTFANESLYAGTSHTLYALDPRSGHVKWTFSPYGTKHERIYSSPTVHKDMVFLGDRAGRFHCLDSRSGKHVWWKQTSRSANSDVNATALPYRHSVIVGTNAGQTVAYEAATGRQVWRTRLDGPCGWELRTFESKVIAPTLHSIYLLDPENGKVVDRWNWRQNVITGCAVTGGTIVAVTQSEASWRTASADTADEFAKIRAVRRRKVVFERLTSKYSWGIRWDAKTGFLYGSRVDGLGILSAATGELIHNITMKPGELMPGLADVQDKIIYLLSMSGNLYALKHP